MPNYLDKDGLLYFWQKIKTSFAFKTELPTATSDLTNDSNFVSDANYVHTDNNYTTAEKETLSSLAGGTVSDVQVETQSGSYSLVSNSVATLKPAATLASATSTQAFGLMSYSQSSKLGKLNIIYGTTSTSPTTAIKDVTYSGGWSAIDAGTILVLKSTYTNSATSASFRNNGSSGSGVSVKYNGNVLGSSTLAYGGHSSRLSLYIFADSAWHWIGWSYETNTTYVAATQSSSGLMSSSDKTKLDGFSSASDYALKSDITGMYKYKGSVATASLLPSSGQETGDVYNIEAASVYGGAGMNVAWNGSAWDPLGEIFSITSVTNAEIDTIVAS